MRRQENLEESRERERRKNYEVYGITLEEYNQMFNEQEGKCKICGRHQSEMKQVLCVDHDHLTGRVRGLLCKYCNVMLGHAHDSPDFFQSAKNYLTGVR